MYWSYLAELVCRVLIVFLRYLRLSPSFPPGLVLLLMLGGGGNLTPVSLRAEYERQLALYLSPFKGFFKKSLNMYLILAEFSRTQIHIKCKNAFFIQNLHLTLGKRLALLSCFLKGLILLLLFMLM